MFSKNKIFYVIKKKKCLAKPTVGPERGKSAFSTKRRRVCCTCWYIPTDVLEYIVTFDPCASGSDST